MKRAEMVATVFAIILGLFLEALAAQPASYPLRVRGGGKLRSRRRRHKRHPL